MMIVEYNSANDLKVQFQDDDHMAIVSCEYKGFKNGKVKNPYYPDVYGKGMFGNKYPAYQGKDIKEYKIWHSLIQRCFDHKTKEKHVAYGDVQICDEWLIYDNFYDWLHSQSNYDKWFVNPRWAIDKDIIQKWNKKYEPQLCCLVPPNVNSLFTRRQNDRGEYPIGVYYYKRGNNYRAQCMNPYSQKRVLIGSYGHPTDAFYAYKHYKEKLIKKIAEDEYKSNNITENCYNAMLMYNVEITD